MLTSYSIFTVLAKEKGINIKNFNLCAGHSLGEYTALLISGSLNYLTQLKFYLIEVNLWQAVPVGEGAMIAVLNVECDETEKF